MSELLLQTPDIDSEDESSIAFETAEWHRRAAIVDERLSKLVAALPEEVKSRPLDEIVAEDHGPGVGERTHKEVLKVVEASGGAALGSAVITLDEVETQVLVA